MMGVHRISVVRLIAKYRRTASVADLPRRPKRRVTTRNQDQHIVVQKSEIDMQLLLSQPELL